MPLNMVRQDITRLRADAIINAANEDLLQGGGVCGAIFAAAGVRDLQRACDEIGHVDCGDAVATPGFALPARYVIHTAGPIWHGGDHGEREKLASCYRRSLELAEELGVQSVAFPLISSGIYGYPPGQALAVALSTIRAHLEEHPDTEVTLCLFDRRATTLAEDLFGDIERYIDDEYARDSPHMRRRRDEPIVYGRVEGTPISAPKFSLFGARSSDVLEDASPSTIEDTLRTMDEPFEVLLMTIIDERGLTDAEVYARANLSRQYFSKLRSGKLNPSKRVVLSLAVALELTPSQTDELLERAGYALSPASKFDLIVEWFITNERYDIYEINEVLFRFDQPLLGSR